MLIIALSLTYTMVEANRVDRLEPSQVIFIWHIVPMPADNIERRMCHSRNEQSALVFGNELIRCYVAILKPCNGRLKVSRIGQPIGADRTKVWQSEMIVKYFQNVSTESGKEKIRCFD